MTALFKPGDHVIYRKQKFSAHPGPHARDIRPAANGDFYSYEVDKYWLVVASDPNNKISVCTRRGKRITLNANDPALRRAHWLERLLFRHRFPALKHEESLPNQPSPLHPGQGHPPRP